ncbi:MAG: aspartate aminotransferase family protein [Tatlockia sp.]|nr:aspartate aminotransferase family protein [Tatlockia sp.]
MNTFEKYQKYINTHPLTALMPFVIDSAKDIYYTTEEGIQFIDCFSGVSVVNTGHSNPSVNAAVIAQLDKLTHCCSYLYPLKPVADCAEKLAQITPGGLSKSFFGSSGAEAIEGAIRLAKQYKRSSGALSLSYSFHGRTNAALSVSGLGNKKKGGHSYAPGVTILPAPYHYRSPLAGKNAAETAENCINYTADLLKHQNSDDIAFFIAEPILGEGGIIVPPDNYFRLLKEVLDFYGILFIADEVQTGFARTGSFFACEAYQIVPDILVMAKGIANGLPLSCFISNEKIAAAFEPGDHLSTFGGNPVCCAAAIANIDFIEKQKLCEAVAKKGVFFLELLKHTLRDCKLIGEIRGKGLMIGCEIVRDAKEPAVKEALQIRDYCMAKGILLGVGGAFGNVVRIQPPLTIEEDQLTQVCDTLKAALMSLN